MNTQEIDERIAATRRRGQMKEKWQRDLDTRILSDKIDAAKAKAEERKLQRLAQTGIGLQPTEVETLELERSLLAGGHAAFGKSCKAVTAVLISRGPNGPRWSIESTMTASPLRRSGPYVRTITFR